LHSPWSLVLISDSLYVQGETKKYSRMHGAWCVGLNAACERGVQYLQDPGHHGVLREDIDGEREELQKELWTWCGSTVRYP
jgi:hypothetical protein